MQSLAVLDGRHALALEGAGEDRGGLSGGGPGLAEGAVDRADVVPVDLDGVPAEGLEAAGVGVQVVAVPGRSALAEPVDVDDRGEVVEMLVRRVLGRLPHRALGQLAVPAQHPHPVADAVQALARERDADADRQSLAERSGGRLHPGQPPGRGMPFERAAQRAEGEQFGVLDQPDRLERGVQQRRGVSLGQHETVVAGVGGAIDVVAEVVGEEDGHQVGGGHGRGRMPGPGGIGGPHTVHAQLLSQFDEFGGVHESPSAGRPVAADSRTVNPALLSRRVPPARGA